MADEKTETTSQTPLTPDQRVAQLLGNIGNEAFSTTGGDIWNAGQPLSGDLTAEHAKESAKPVEKPAVETTSDQKLIAGKWKTDEEAQKGIHELIHYAKASLERAEKAEVERNELVKRLGSVLSPGNGAPTIVDPLDELESVAAIPKEHFRKAVRGEFDSWMAEKLQPEVDKRKADEEVVKIFPEYGKEFDNMLAFVNQNPAIRDDVAYAEQKGEYLLARKYAWSLFDAHRKAIRQDKVSEQVQTRQEKVEESRPDAGFLGGTGTGGHGPEATRDWPEPKRLEYLKKLAKSGHPDMLFRETIGRMLDRQGWENI